MRVLVTGGAGFLGSHLVEALLARGDEVVVIDDLSRGHREQIPTGVEFVAGDVRETSVWHEVCSQFKPELIHHLAAVNGTRRFHREADLVVDVNVNGTRNALIAARMCGARLVFYSSPEAFGEQEEMPLSSDSNSVFPPAHLHQRHSYGSSKHIGELLCQHAVRDGLDVRIIRPFNVYGPRLHGDEDGQVVAMMMASDPIEVHGDGHQTRSLTWVGDVVSGMVECGIRDGLSGRSFNLGSTEEISMIDLAKKISELRGVDINHVGTNHGDSKRRLPCLSGNENLDWFATTSLDEGLAQLL